MRISVIGLGKLGAPLAAVVAYKGHTVIGVDVDARAVRLINQGKAPIFEPGLDELIGQVHERLSATNDYDVAIANTDVTHSSSCPRPAMRTALSRCATSRLPLNP